MQRFPIPNIYTQTFLWLDDRVQHHLAWRDDEYTQLVMLLLGKTRWRNSDKASLRLEITLSLLTGGRSSATVLKLAFVDDAKRTDTLIIRSHLTQADAETEKQNAKKLRVNTVDCFANLAEEEQFNLPNRYLVIYEDVAGNLVKEGETVAELSEALSRTLPSQSLDNITHFAKNFQEVIRQVTATYEEVNKKYDMVGGEQYYQQIRSQLPPDFVISQGVSVVEAISKDVVVQSQMPTESPQVISMTEFESQLAEEKYAAANWLQLQEQLWLEEKETVLTGDSQIAYLPFMAKEKNQTVRIWVGIAQDDVESIQPMLNINKGYQLTWLATERVTFTAQLENMGFDKQGCLSISAFQALTQKRYPHLQTDMRHNDLHCGNVLASGSSVKVIDVGDMERSLLAADIARLEVSIWFEVSKRLSQTLSKAKAETIIQNSYIGKAAASDSSQLVLLLSCILKSLREGFFEGVALKPQPFEIEAAYVTQILLYQRYCLLDGLKEIPPAFNVFACHWMNQAQRPLAELTPEYSEQRKASGPNPYLGLSAFQEEDAQRFFGREALTEKLWETFSNLLHPEPNRKPPPRLLPILGPSGSGKSSVARAGLVPALKHRLLPGLTGMRIEIITPTERPLENLARVLARIATQESSPVAKTLEFENLFKHHNDGLRRIVDALPDIDTAPLVILIDQFEETYTLCQEAKERTAFIDNLMVAVQDTTARLSVILTLRSDFLAETQRHEAFNQTIAEQSVIVPMMNKTELHRAISQPAEQAGCPLDAATVELLIKDTEEREGALPLLQFALLEIWEGIREGIAPVDKLKEIGGVGGALAKKADALYQQLPDAEKNLARRAFLKLVQLGDGTKNTRHRVELHDMVAYGETEEQMKKVLRRFSGEDARLITLSQATAEITHEALLENWGTLKAWLDKSRDDLRFEYRLDEAAKYWDAQQKEKGLKKVEGLLWHSPDLDLLRDFHKHHGKEMTGSQVAFFKASVHQQRKTFVIRGLTVIFIFALAYLSLFRPDVVKNIYQVSREKVINLTIDTFRDTLKDGSFGPEMVWIPAGTFKMGDPHGPPDEQPVHEVSVKRLAIGRYEITFVEYDKFAIATDREQPGDKDWGRGNRPVIDVSWDDAKAYAEWLSRQTGRHYRLPTESEWEYVARAGTETNYWWGNEIGFENANCAASKTVQVGSFKPNLFGLYDTAGNVWEWVADPRHDNYKGAPTDGSVWEGEGNLRVLRGGSFIGNSINCRAANRISYSSDDRNYGFGIRVAVGPVAWAE